jgi:hypothetical protein
MSYQEYIVSKTRLARLEAHDQPYFASMNDTDLQKEMTLRRIPLVGTRSHMIHELEQHYQTMYSEYMKRLLQQDKRMHRDRLELMLTSSFERDPSRFSFMDLTGEIRNIIYVSLSLKVQQMTFIVTTGTSAGPLKYSIMKLAPAYWAPLVILDHRSYTVDVLYRY